MYYQVSYATEYTHYTTKYRSTYSMVFISPLRHSPRVAPRPQNLEPGSRVPVDTGTRVTIHYWLPFWRLSRCVVRRKVGGHGFISSLSLNHARKNTGGKQDYFPSTLISLVKSSGRFFAYNFACIEQIIRQKPYPGTANLRPHCCWNKTNT